MSYNTTVSHVSPVLSYVPGLIWTEGTTEDSYENEYWEESYHATNASQGQGRVLFDWFGTDIWLFGGYRERLGSYKVVLDGTQTYEFSGFRDGDPEDFNAVLFNTTNLPVTYHQLEVVNTSNDSQRAVLDISHLVYQSNYVETTSVPSTSTACRWGPQALDVDVWTASASSHTTSHPLGSMEFNFTGDFFYSSITTIIWTNSLGTGIALYGLTGINSSPFTVFIDGITPQTFTPNSQITPSANDTQLLFVRNDLVKGDHTLVVRNNPAATSDQLVPTTLNIQNMVIYAADAETSSPNVMSSGGRHANLVVAYVVGAIAFLFLCFAIWLCVRCRRRRTQRLSTLRRPRPFILDTTERPDSTRSSKTESLLSHDTSTEESVLLFPGVANAEELFSPGSPTCVDGTSPRRASIHGQRRSLWKPLRLTRPFVPPPLPLHDDWPIMPPPILSPPGKAISWPDSQLPPPYRIRDAR